MPKQKLTKQKITRDQFHELVKKAAQPLVPNESDLEPLETSDAVPDGDYSGTHIRLNKTGDI